LQLQSLVYEQQHMLQQGAAQRLHSDDLIHLVDWLDMSLQH
jgi:hypothetical protein